MGLCCASIPSGCCVDFKLVIISLVLVADKADKRAEKEKLHKVEQERLNREEEMRELALRLRRK